MSKRKWGARIGQAVRNNALALAALLISSATLYFGLEAQRTDRLYKEASIRPALTADILDFEYRLVLKNVGLGPAVLKRMSIGNGPQCVDSAKLSKTDWYEKSRPVWNALIWRFMEEQPMQSAVSKNDFILFSTIGPEQIVPAAGEREIFKLDTAVSEKARASYMRLDSASASSASAQYAEALRRLAFSFEYCSMTGAYCDGINMSSERESPVGCH